MSEQKEQKFELTVRDSKRNKDNIYNAIKHVIASHPFYGYLIQNMRFMFREDIPAIAGVGWDSTNNTFTLVINPVLFNTFSVKEQKAVLLHEVFHIAHKHVYLFDSGNKEALTPENKELAKKRNISMDATINQLIPNIPKGCIEFDKLPAKKGIVLAPHMNWQYYFDNVDFEEHEKEQKKRAENGGSGQQTDIHELIDGEGVSEEAKLKGAKDLFQRTINKSAFNHSQVPDAVKDLIKEIDARLSKIDYKRELEAAVKKSVMTGDRKGTWTRPSKRFGYYSQGTKFKDAPKICVLADTSGSISHTEIAEMSNQIADILKAVDHELTIGLWHTSLYHTSKFKKNMDFKSLSVESGGTDVTEALKYANNNKFDFVIVFTDGYVPDLAEKINMTKPVLFVITRTGTKNHPLVKLGKTIQMV